MNTLLSPCRSLSAKQVIDLDRIERAYENDELWSEVGIYRQYTVAVLRRYFQMSIDLGKIPSVLGMKEFFRAKVSSRRGYTFEDVVVFVHDIDRCMEKLDIGSRWLVARFVFQEYTVDEVAETLGLSSKQVRRRYAAAIDGLSTILLERDLLMTLDEKKNGRTVRSVLNEHAGGLFGEATVEAPLLPKKRRARTERRSNTVRHVRWSQA